MSTGVNQLPGGVDCPAGSPKEFQSEPQQATEPSLHTPQVWNAPALTELKSPDINVTAGIRHVYRVKAINAAGVGPQSNYVR